MPRKKLGLALGSGGAKGFAHIGVLKALNEFGVEPDVLVGSSMGSLVGAFYVSGMKPAFMERLAASLGWRHWMDFTIPKMGIIAGEKIHQMVTLLTKGMHFHDVNMPFGIVATEVTTRSLVLFQEGRISDAVRASISIPGIFVPFVTEQGVYIDGGVLERVPVEACRQLGADVVIAVDVSAVVKPSVPENMMDVIMASIDIMQQQLVEPRILSADVKLEPDVSEVGSSQFHKAVHAIEAGYESTRKNMAAILEMVAMCQGETDEAPGLHA